MINFKNQEKEAEKIKRAYHKKFKQPRVTIHIRLRSDLYEAIKKISEFHKSTLSKTLDEIVENTLYRVQE